jgi:hypothetical protein
VLRDERADGGQAGPGSGARDAGFTPPTGLGLPRPFWSASSPQAEPAVHSQPRSSAVLTASARLRAPALAIAADR